MLSSSIQQLANLYIVIRKQIYSTEFCKIIILALFLLYFYIKYAIAI
jgi:hypothetical protein